MLWPEFITLNRASPLGGKVARSGTPNPLETASASGGNFAKKRSTTNPTRSILSLRAIMRFSRAMFCWQLGTLCSTTSAILSALLSSTYRKSESGMPPRLITMVGK